MKRPQSANNDSMFDSIIDSIDGFSFRPGGEDDRKRIRLTDPKNPNPFSFVTKAPLSDD